MSKQILVNFSHYETRVATLENGEIRSLHIEREEDKNVVGNIYLGVVKRVLPGMQAAFLELGLERTAFLYVDDIIDQPFGGDVDLLDESSESEGDGEASLELGADDDGEPLKESYDEEVAEEGGRQRWEREVTEVGGPSEASQPVQAQASETETDVGEPSEEFFEKSPEERAEELVVSTEEEEDDDDEEEEEELYESDDIDDEDLDSDANEEEIEAREASSEEDEDFREEELEPSKETEKQLKSSETQTEKLAEPRESAQSHREQSSESVTDPKESKVDSSEKMASKPAD